MIRKTAIGACLALGLIAALPLAAQRGDDSKQVSKNGKTEATIGGVGVVVEYGRPLVKERKIWGALVPYGKVWRTGANEATTLTLDRDATVGGQRVAKGTYSLFTIPTESGWTVILNRVAKQWGSYEYDEKQDAARIAATPRATEHVEALDFVAEGGELVLRWEKVAVPIAIAAAN